VLASQPPTVVSFMTANFVARELGWSMPDWAAGDRAVQDAFRPIATYRERFSALCDEAVSMGFTAVDVWDAHLNPAWASDEHLEIARDVLAERSLRVASLAGWFGVDAEQVERACQIAVALGAPVLGGGVKLLWEDRGALIGLLERYDLRFGLENHPERSPDEVLERIGDDAGGRIGVTVDTGWWGTQGYDAARAIRELAARLFHVHLKDVRHAGMPHETCGYGRGIVPLEACVEALRGIGYRGAISVEHEPDEGDPRPEIRRARELLEEWLAA
jgi:sugar phosphate isomerase/epimerase